MTPVSRVLLVHAAVYAAVALGLLGMARPVNWQTPTNLWAQEDVGFLVIVVLVVAGVLGSLEGVSLALSHRVPGWLFATLALGVGGSVRRSTSRRRSRTAASRGLPVARTW